MKWVLVAICIAGIVVNLVVAPYSVWEMYKLLGREEAIKQAKYAALIFVPIVSLLSAYLLCLL